MGVCVFGVRLTISLMVSQLRRTYICVIYETRDKHGDTNTAQIFFFSLQLIPIQLCSCEFNGMEIISSFDSVVLNNVLNYYSTQRPDWVSGPLEILERRLSHSHLITFTSQYLYIFFAHTLLNINIYVFVHFCLSQQNRL